MAQGNRLRFPAHSPDIDQVVGRSIKGWSYHTRYNEMEMAQKMVYGKHSLQRMFKDQVKLIEEGQLFPRGVEDNFNTLPTVLEVIAADEGQLVKGAKLTWEVEATGPILTTAEPCSPSSSIGSRHMLSEEAPGEAVAQTARELLLQLFGGFRVLPPFLLQHGCLMAGSCITCHERLM